MRNYFKTVLLLLLSVNITGVLKAQSFTKFTIDGDGHILIKASINGVEGTFLFDTGAGITLISKSFAAKIGTVYKQDSGYTGFRATGEKLYTDMYRVAVLQIGDQRDILLQSSIVNRSSTIV
jgi:predicted aspartyl protease